MLVKWGKMLFRYCLKRPFLENASATTAVFPGASKRGNPTMTKSAVTTRRKGDAQHYVEGKNENPFAATMFFLKIIRSFENTNPENVFFRR